jgi:NAD-dependent dihydropyrimidine dehydrogenase PreA subunit
MCTFCVQHGDGKRWYANARNYAFDLESDLRRRGFMVDFVRNFERTRRSIDVGLAALRYLPRPIEKAVAERVTRSQQREHFGQPIPLEECARIFDRATNITRLPCVCRGAMKAGSDAESCCIVMTVASHDGTLSEAFRDYSGGPQAQGFEKLTKTQALAVLRRAEAAGLAHTAWTFLTPFVAAICNCDLPSGCMAMKVQFRGGVRVMWKGEDVARHAPDRCDGCGECIGRCPFEAIRPAGEGAVALDRSACWGCGTCRSACSRGAIRLEPRATAPDVAASW